VSDQWGSEPIWGHGWCVALIAASALFVFGVSAWYVLLP
jgi:hypothetical protein